MTRYRKTGTTVRYERRSGFPDGWIHTSEGGEFIDGGEQFEVRSGLSRSDDAEAGMEHRAEVDRIVAALPDSQHIEQLVVTSGQSSHQYETRTWTERSAQMMVTIADPLRHVRYTLMRGGTIDETELAGSVAEVLDLLSTLEQPALGPGEVTLAAECCAELVRALLHSSCNTTIEFAQQAPPFSRHDGVGAIIESRTLRPGRDSFPIYRPSYRYPPVAHPLHILARFPRTGRSSETRVLNLLEPPRILKHSIELSALVVSGKAASLQRIQASVDTLAFLDDSPNQDAVWFPVAGGTWGERLNITATMMQPLINEDRT